MKRLIKLMSVALCLTIVLSASLVGVFALSMNGISLGGKDKATPDEAELFKDETVYVMAKADGTVDKIIVSDWIKNNKGAATITDVSTIEDIENVKTDASFTLDSDNMRVWEANGEDLYLKGTGKEPLPVDLCVTYALDGKVISPEDLAGKSGKVTIRFDYTNNAYETVKIDGKDEKIYVPFLMMSGMILDGAKFSNVTVTNGKVISDGDRVMLAGIAFPGLQHDLGLTRDEIDIPSYFEVNADVENFELGTTVTIAANGLAKDLNVDDLDSLDSLKDSLNSLESAMTALINGSSQLYTGLETLLEKSGELSDGVDQLYAGAEQLSDGAAQVSDGAKQLYDGADALNAGTITLDLGALNLSSGLETLDSNSGLLNAGSDQTFDAILATAQKSLKDAGLDVPALTADNYADVLNGLLDNLSEENVRALAEATAKEKVTAAVEANRETVADLTGQNMQSEAVQATITANTDAKIQSLIAENMQSVEVQNGIADALAKAKAGRESIAALKTQLDSYNTFNKGLKTYTDGVGSASAGAAQLHSGTTQIKLGSSALKNGASDLKDGTEQLSEGADTLKNGILTMKNGVPALVDGVSRLRDGSMKLSDGLKQFNDEGISKITSLLKNDVGDLAERLKATIKAAQNYKSYSGLTENMDGEVKFIYKTEEIQ